MMTVSILGSPGAYAPAATKADGPAQGREGANEELLGRHRLRGQAEEDVAPVGEQVVRRAAVRY